MGITTYLLSRNRDFGIERRRLLGVRTGRVRVSLRVTDVHILVIYGSKRGWSGGLVRDGRYLLVPPPRK